MTKEKINNKKLNSDETRSFFIETIAKFCDKCGTAYSSSDLHIVQNSDYSSIIHFTCSNCKSRHIASFIKPIGMSSRMPINTDLSVDEVKKFAVKEEILSDNIIDVNSALQKSKSIKI